MKNIPCIAFLLIFLSVILPCKATCAILHLKTGSPVEGTIIEETDTYVKILFYEVPLRYDRSEIETVENAQARTENIDTSLKNNEDLILNGLYEDAVKTLSDLTGRNPTNSGYYNNYAVALALKGDYQAAATAFKKALELETGDYATIINYNLAHVYCRLNLIPQAKALIEKIASENLRDLIERTVALKSSGINASSILMASSYPPDTAFLAPQPLTGPDNILTAQKNQANSLNDIAYIIEDFPLLFLYDSPLAYVNLSFSAIAGNRLPDAKRYLDSAEKRVGKERHYQDKLALAGVYFARGQICLEEHNYYVARKNFKKAIELFDRWSIFHKYLGTTYYLLHTYPKAAEEFKTAIMLLGRDTPEAAEMEEYLKKIEDVHQKQ